MTPVRTRSLGFQLGATFLLVGLAPAILFGVVALTTTLGALRESVVARNQALARGVASETGRFLDNQLLHLREVALAASLHPELAGDPGHLVQHFAINPALRSLVVLDSRNRVVVALPLTPELIGADFSSHPYVREARRLDAPTWSTSPVTGATSEPSVALVIPGPRWTVVGYLGLDPLTQIVHRAEADDGTMAAVIDGDGALIARRAAPLLRHPLTDGALRLITGASTGGERTARLTFEGREWLGSAVAVPATGWVALVMEPTETAYASADRLRLLLFATFAGIIGLALGAGYLSARRILRPVRALAA
ncbi:MAG: cache domain-containing protein, partial [Anaeromyxobacteraceae bacterium]